MGIYDYVFLTHKSITDVYLYPKCFYDDIRPRPFQSNQTQYHMYPDKNESNFVIHPPL